MSNYLASVQAKLKAPKNQRNTFGNYNYRSCEDILEALKQIINPDGYSIHLTDTVEAIGGRVYVKAVATLTNGQESYTSTAYAREEETKKGMDGSQITGAASSYARKYALNGLFAIDDTKDADATNTHGKEEAPQTQHTPTTQQTELPWMTEKQYTELLRRILAGENGLFEKAKTTHRMKKEYAAGLADAEKSTPTYMKGE